MNSSFSIVVLDYQEVLFGILSMLRLGEREGEKGIGEQGDLADR